MQPDSPPAGQPPQPLGPGDLSAPPQGTGQPARRATADAPTTAYEYPAGDRGAPAAEHERQMREVLSGPSRDDAARGQPRRSTQGTVPDDAGPAEGREQRIRAAAHALAAQRGFAPGHEVDDWLQAERQVDSDGGAAP